MTFSKFWKAYLWTVIILYLSFAPSESFPEVGIINFDKVVHLLIYYSQTFLFINAFHKRGLSYSKKFLYVPFIVCISTGLLTEILQGTSLINRNSDWLDMIANTSGVVLAIVTFKPLYNSRLNKLLQYL